MNDDLGFAVDVAIEHDGWGALDGVTVLAERAVGAALAVAADAPTDAEVSLVLCDDAFIRALNRTWRGKDQPTNVLSFPTDAPGTGPALLGDIVVAYQTSAREADEEGRSLGDHLAHLIVHGMLHLLDYDHGDDGAADVMEGLESRALASIGIASPYAVEAGPLEAGPLEAGPLDVEDARARP